MAPSPVHPSLYRIRDLVERKRRGAAVGGQTYFDVIPMAVAHGDDSFSALMFLCHYRGFVDSEAFSFRKCYARGCPNDGCPDVASAIRTANHRFAVDCRRLEQAGIPIEQRGLTLERIIAKLGNLREIADPLQCLYDGLTPVPTKKNITVEPTLTFVRAVEHHPHYELPTIFLMAIFTISQDDETYLSERCLACYCQDEEEKEKTHKISIANTRLASIYKSFSEAAIDFRECYFGRCH